MQKYSLIVAVVLQLLFFISAHAEDYPDVTDSGLRIEEVVVTVSKRSESLQDVLGSVSALSGEMIAEQNIQDFRKTKWAREYKLIFARLQEKYPNSEFLLF